MKSNIICGVIYRQHNSPASFQTYFDETLEKLSNSGKPIYVLGDFNINLLNAETCNFTKDFLLSLQSYSFIPTIDKPTRVNSNSATLKCMCQLFPKFDILSIILPVCQHESTKSIHFYMHMVTFKLSGLILHFFYHFS